MESNTDKCVMVVDQSLPPGLIANTTAILGITIGKRFPNAVGQDVTDASGGVHAGIIAFPVPVLKGDAELLTALHTKLAQPEYAELSAVDFTDIAQGCKAYDEFIDKMACAPGSALSYFGIAIYGNKKQVNKLTGSLPLLR